MDKDMSLRVQYLTCIRIANNTDNHSCILPESEALAEMDNESFCPGCGFDLTARKILLEMIGQIRKQFRNHQG